MKARTEHHLSKWRIIVTAATVVVDRLDRKKKKRLIADVSTPINRITTLTMEVQRCLGFPNTGLLHLAINERRYAAGKRSL